MKNLRFLALILVVCFMLPCGVVFSDTETLLYPVDDTYTSSLDADKNYAYEKNILVGTDNEVSYSGYVRFNIGNSVTEKDRIMLVIEADTQNAGRIAVTGCANNDFISADVTGTNSSTYVNKGNSIGGFLRNRLWLFYRITVGRRG